MTNEIENYVDIIENKSAILDVKEMVSVCKRLNNTKRDFLFVNKYQGKHFPQNPSKILKILDELIENIQEKEQKTLVIGFAETATAIGNYVASKLENCIFEMQTTREIIEGEEPIIKFQEEHSHAPSQLLYGKKEIFSKIDRVMFVEDEITTGKTIINFINELNKINPNLNYAVTSILNWQDEENDKLYKQLNIKTYYLIKGKIKDVNAKVEVDTIKKYECKEQDEKQINYKKVKSELCNLKATRLGRVPIKDNNFYENYIFDKLSQKSEILRKIKTEQNKKVLIIGTEEFMYEPLLLAKYLEDNTSHDIFYQATTRSPIEVSKQSNYILKERFEFVSAYEEERKTYLYNLKKYDYILIITDSEIQSKFIKNISDILIDLGNDLKNLEIIALQSEI